MTCTTREPQYQDHVTLREKRGLTRLGLRANATWQSDPKRLVFSLARYKFAAKMLSGKDRVLEVGCGDAFDSRIVVQEVGHLCAVDFDPVFVQDALDRMDDQWPFECLVHDILEAPVPGPFDAAYSIDVIEHIAPEHERTFLTNIVRSLTPEGVLIIGTPSLNSQAYASELSKQGHVNCKDHQQLKTLLLDYFHHVFLFSMNDEVIHTGFYAMAHYLLALCAGLKNIDRPDEVPIGTR